MKKRERTSEKEAKMSEFAWNSVVTWRWAWHCWKWEIKARKAVKVSKNDLQVTKSKHNEQQNTKIRSEKPKGKFAVHKDKNYKKNELLIVEEHFCELPHHFSSFLWAFPSFLQKGKSPSKRTKMMGFHIIFWLRNTVLWASTSFLLMLCLQHSIKMTRPPHSVCKVDYLAYSYQVTIGV